MPFPVRLRIRVILEQRGSIVRQEQPQKFKDDEHNQNQNQIRLHLLGFSESSASLCATVAADRAFLSLGFSVAILSVSSAINRSIADLWLFTILWVDSAIRLVLA